VPIGFCIRSGSFQRVHRKGPGEPVCRGPWLDGCDPQICRRGRGDCRFGGRFLFGLKAEEVESLNGDRERDYIRKKGRLEPRNGD
jgi:hypothetical protein